MIYFLSVKIECGKPLDAFSIGGVFNDDASIKLYL